MYAVILQHIIERHNIPLRICARGAVWLRHHPSYLSFPLMLTDDTAGKELRHLLLKTAAGGVGSLHRAPWEVLLHGHCHRRIIVLMCSIAMDCPSRGHDSAGCRQSDARMLNDVLCIIMFLGRRQVLLMSIPNGVLQRSADHTPPVSDQRSFIAGCGDAAPSSGKRVRLQLL